VYTLLAYLGSLFFLTWSRRGLNGSMDQVRSMFYFLLGGSLIAIVMFSGGGIGQRVLPEL